jgi:hypothetical protein
MVLNVQSKPFHGTPHGFISLETPISGRENKECVLFIEFLYTGKGLQMSLWGRTVITSLASALPVVGTSIVGWLWGGFAVDNPTLNRFYSFHYLFPF